MQTWHACITVVYMNSSNNSNAPDTKGINDTDAWNQFVSEHADELQDMERSNHAKRFEQHVRRLEKKQQLAYQQPRVKTPGPRDTTTSWLDVDETMDNYDDGFTAPNPDFPHPSRIVLLMWIFIMLGVAGIIISAFVPMLAYLLGTSSAVILLIASSILLIKRRKPDNFDDEDDGARV